jgi:citrate lyase subunit beta/citryl-CoA lyase
MTFALGPALLFCPADRPERYAKALDRADGVILDLEDAVAPADKVAARGALIDAQIDPQRVIVRVCPLGTPDFEADMATLSQTDFRTIMVAKAESAKRISRIDPRFEVIALCETARGVALAEKIAAAPNVVGLMWGAEDLVASLGGTSSRKTKGGYRDVARHARSRVLLAAGAEGIAAIDAVHLDIADDRGLRREAMDAAASGFAASACIHPGQVETIRAAYRPDTATLTWARAVLAAAEGERGVFRFDGRMIDEPVLRHARTVLARA